MSQNINIIKLMEENPNTKLSKPYQGKLINKLKDNFSTAEQQLFITSFYCYLNYTSNEFVIDLDDIWVWLGFARKTNAKNVLEKQFTKETDYLFLPQPRGNLLGGRPSEKIMLNIKTFKKFCLRANTSKANEIHEYYIKLEETLHEVIDEESNELRLQLEMKDEIIQMKDEQLEKKDEIINRLQTRNVCYLCTTDEKESKGIYMVGKTSDLQNINFKIVYYISCKSELMEPIEVMILSILNKYKISKNIFQLPKEKDVSFFIQYFDKLKIFCDDIEEDLVLEENKESHSDYLETEKVINKSDKENVKCICGMSISKGHMKRHEESKIHKSYIEATQKLIEV